MSGGRPYLGIARKNTTIDLFQQELVQELDAMGIDYSVFVRRLEEKAFDKSLDDVMQANRTPEKYYVLLLILRHSSPLTLEEIRSASDTLETDEDTVARLKELRRGGIVRSYTDGRWGLTASGRRFINSRFKKLLDERLSELLLNHNLPAREARDKNPAL